MKLIYLTVTVVEVILIFIASQRFFVVGTQLKLQNACKFSQFRCNEGDLCLETEKLCNGIEDCPQGEDERGTEQYDCTRSTLSDDCKPDQFRCRFGGCISTSLRCDGNPDCWGGTDEANDFCGYQRPKSGQRPTTTGVPPPSSTPSSIIYTQNQYPPLKLTTTTQNYYQTTMTPPPIWTIQRSSSPSYESSSRPTTTTTTFKTTSTTTEPTTITTTTKRSTTTTVKTQDHQHSGKSSCPVIELEDGQKASCFQQRLAQEIQCSENPSPNGTRAEISCRQYWSPPETGPHRTIKHCKDGQWHGGSGEFTCELDCGSGGYPPQGYVTGGMASVQGKWPWHAGLYESDPPGSENYRHICGATLVTRQALVTAAHCVAFPSTNTKKNARDLRVYLGKFYRSFDMNNEYVQAIDVRHIELHSKYNFAQLESDIAILWLERPAEITSFVHPVCLPHEDFDGPYVGDSGSLAGWGSLGDRNYPKILNEAVLPVRSNHECTQNSPVLANLVRESTFCAGHSNGTSACDGDSGGGLVFPHSQNSNKWTILGVVSGGVPKAGGRGCDAKYYAAFTKISNFKKFIDRTLDALSS